MEGKTVVGRQGRRRKQLPDIWWGGGEQDTGDGKRKRSIALGGGYGPVVRQITKWMNERHATECHLTNRQWSNQTTGFPPLKNLKNHYLVQRTPH